MTAALLAALLVPAAAPPGGDLAAFLPPAAWGVWYADLTAWDDKTFAAAERMGEAGSWYAGDFRALHGALSGAGANGLYVPLDPLRLARSTKPPAFVLLKPGADAEAVRAAVEAAEEAPGDPLFARPVTIETRGDATAIVSGFAPPNTATDRPALAAAVAAAPAPTGAIYSPTDAQRAALAALLPPGGPLDPDTAAAAKWAALSYDPAAEKPVTFAAEATSPAAAAALAELPRTLAGAFGFALPDGFALAVEGTFGSAALTLEEAQALAASAGVSGPAVAAAVRRTQNNLKQIALAMHNFHSRYGSFPPTASYTADGKPLLSWRVHLLRYLDQGELYERFRLDEPWDSAHNKALLKEMPEVFRSPRAATEPGMTVYQVPFGPGLPFAGRAGVPLSEYKDGTTATILAVEAADPVPWTKPADWSPDLSDADSNPVPGLLAGPNGVAFYAMADGSVQNFAAATMPPATLRKLLTLQGGEVVTDEDYE